MPLEVFVSHAHRDQKIAEALVTFLNMGAGIEIRDIRCTSFAPSGLQAGADINSALRRDLKRCQYFMPLITANAAESDFVSFEIGAAWVLAKEIVPVVYKLASRQRMPAILSGLLSTDLTNKTALIKLATELTSKIFHANDQTKAPQIVAAANGFLSTIRR